MSVLSVGPEIAPATGALRLVVMAPGTAELTCVHELQEHGFSLAYAGSLGDAVRQIVAGAPDAVLALTDDAAAIEHCEVLSALGSHPIVVASAALKPAIAAACLDKGADAAIALPVAAAELAARIRAVLRRLAQDGPEPATHRILAGELTIDLAARAVWWRGTPVELSPTEFDLLTALAESPGRVVTNRQLLSRVWGEQYVDDVHYVRLYIGYLRSKLEDDPRHPRLILNQWGVGYRLAQPGTPDTAAASRHE